jgi:hypothetical protein
MNIEGDKDFVESLLERLLPLVEAVGFGSGFKNAERNYQNDEQSQSSQNVANDSEPKQRQRRAGKKPPKGQSCADRITTLIDKGYFRDKRSPSEVAAELGINGWTHTGNQVGASLLSMFDQDRIQRTKDGNKKWKYYWDRDSK